MKLLISGGAGYIGSHMVRYAQESGHEVVVLDDLSTGNISMLRDCEIITINLLDEERLLKALNGRLFDGVIHFAAKSIVSDSLIMPDLYYYNNVVGSLNLINLMLKNGIQNLVFSSSAAIFGEPTSKKISEDHLKNPINPYGKSKLMVENILKDLCLTFDLNAVCLRYFNAAGAHKSGEIGELHNPETHLIPNVLRSIFDSEAKLKVFGDNYPTHDGTCIRDYVHVTDLSHAHFLALQHMNEIEGFSAFNLGNGEGFSVLDIIKSCERVSGKAISIFSTWHGQDCGSICSRR